MAVDTEYEEDARRIEREYVSPSSTTREEIEQDLQAEDFANEAVDDIKEWILSEEDVGGPALAPHSDGVTTREEIEQAVEQADGVGYGQGRHEAVTSEIARDVGAPSESELQQATMSAVSEAVQPGEVIEGDDRSTPVSVVRDTDGNVAGTVGGAAARDVAEEMGAEHLGDLNDFRDSMTVRPAPDGSRGLLYAGDGDVAVGEVNLE